MDKLLGCDLIHDSGNKIERSFPTSCERLYAKSDEIFTTSGLRGIFSSPPHDEATSISLFIFLDAKVQVLELQSYP